MRKFLSLFAILLFAACGSGGGGGGGGGIETHELTGLLTDPAISGARVELYTAEGALAANCGANLTRVCATYSREDGTFSFNIAQDRDVTGYYFATFGGIDGAYKNSFDGLSLYAHLKGDHTVISPLTTLVSALMLNGLSERAAEERVKDALSLSDTATFYADPASSAPALKASFIAARALLSSAAVDPAIELAKALKSNAGKTLLSDEVLDDYLSGADGLADVKDAIKSAAAQAVQNNDPDFINACISAAKKDKLNLLKAALKEVVSNVVSTPSAVYDTNAEALYNTLASSTDVLPVKKEAFSQILSFIFVKDSALADYSSWQTSIQSSLDAVVAAAGGLEEFGVTVKGLATDLTYSIKAPLAVPLGNDNAKRAAYYFNSDADINYKARKLISKVYSDSVNDYIYLQVINAYAQQGYADKAERYARGFVTGTINRAKAYAYLAKYSSSQAEAERRVNYAKGLFNTVRQSSGLTSDLVDGYVVFVNILSSIDAPAAASLREELFSGLNANVGISNWYTLKARFVSSQQNNVIKPLLEAGSYEEAYRATNTFTAMVAALEGSTAANPYATNLMYMANAALFYEEIGQQLPAYASEAKAKISALMPKIEEYKNSYVSKAANGWQWKMRSYYGYLAGPVYWAAGWDYVKAHILDPIYYDDDSVTPDTGSNASGGYNEAVYQITLAYGEEGKGFDEVVAFYEGKFPLTMDCANLTASYGYVDAFTYYNDTPASAGYAKRALLKGRNAAAEAALDYIVGKIDGCVNNLTAANKLLLVSRTATPLRYNSGSYQKAADLYIRLGKNSKATAALDKAITLTDSLGASLNQSTAYAITGYYYRKAGEAAKAASAFASARNVTLPGGATETNKTDFYVGIAKDYSLYTDLANAAANLDTALTHAVAINIATSTAWVTKIISVATGYWNALKQEKAKDALLQALNASGQLTSATNKISAYKSTVQAYAKFGLTEEAKSMADNSNYFPSSADRDDALKEAAYYATLRDDFEEITAAFGKIIAFIDTDRDGKPDFFAPGVTAAEIAASGLTLDDDIDGDGYPDTVDLYPYDATRN